MPRMSIICARFGQNPLRYYIGSSAMPSPMNMNSFEGKRILALIREGDYAHAGEEEAIERSFRSIPKNGDSWLLDVGCGRGGSAEYLRRHGWGHVEGIDRDAESIEYARTTYPEIGFHVCDVLDVPRTVTRKFRRHLHAQRVLRVRSPARGAGGVAQSREARCCSSSSSTTPSARSRVTRRTQ